MIIPTVSLPHYPARPCRPQGGFGLVMMMVMMMVVMDMVKMLPQEKARVWLPYFFANWHNVIITITGEKGYKFFAT